MRTALLITARMGSSRLPGKHLRAMGRSTALETLCQRILKAFSNEITLGRLCVCIATGQEPDNRQFEDVAPLGVGVQYGASRNIPLRHLQAAQALDAQSIVSVDGDDILCSPAAMRAVYAALAQGHPYVTTQGLPLGMNAFGYSLAFLEQSLAGRPPEAVLETGWGHIFDESQLHVIAMTPLDSLAPPLRFTLDYPADLEFFQAVAQALGDALETAEDATIVRVVRERGLARLNAHLNEEYARNFTHSQDTEKTALKAGVV